MKDLIAPREKVYFGICVVVSILLYAALIISIVGAIYILAGVIAVFLVNGFFIGTIRSNGVKVSESQFPEAFHIALQLADKMEMQLPDIYILQAGGALNAMTTRFLRRNFMIIFSDVLEMAYEEGQPALAFIVAHELAHIKCKHLSLRWLIYPSLLIPFLGTAYSRACEYTCDSFGAYYTSQGSVNGLLILAAGKQLYKKVDVNSFVEQVNLERGFFVWLAEVLATHPPLSKRVQAVLNKGSNQTVYTGLSV